MIKWDDVEYAYYMSRQIKTARLNARNLEASRDEERAERAYEYMHSRLVYAGDVEAMVADDMQKWDTKIASYYAKADAIENSLRSLYDADFVDFLMETPIPNEMRFEKIVANYLEEQDVSLSVRVLSGIFDLVHSAKSSIISRYINEGDDCEADLKLPAIVPELLEIAQQIHRSEDVTRFMETSAA